MQRLLHRTIGALLTSLLLWAAPVRAQWGASVENGWSFRFSGDVSAFAIYENTATDGTTLGGFAPPGTKGFDIRSGMLPAMATFSTHGRDGGRDLGATVTFAPDLQTFGGQSSSLPNLDVRQAFLTVSLHGGTLLAGRDVGLFGRNAMLNDMTMFGTGPTNGPGQTGTTFGRFGTGYNYPNSTAQLTWSSAAGKSSQVTLGLFDPSSIPPAFTRTTLPRVEAQWAMTGGSHTLWVDGMLQNVKDPSASALTSFGGSGGFKWWNAKLTLVATAFYGSGIGSLYNFVNATDNIDGRTTVGGYGQAMVTMNGRTSLGVSYGLNQVTPTDAEVAPKITQSSLIAGLYTKHGKMLRSTLEGTYVTTSDDVSGNTNDTGFYLSAGLMLLW